MINAFNPGDIIRVRPGQGKSAHGSHFDLTENYNYIVYSSTPFSVRVEGSLVDYDATRFYLTNVLGHLISTQNQGIAGQVPSGVAGVAGSGMSSQGGIMGGAPITNRPTQNNPSGLNNWLLSPNQPQPSNFWAPGVAVDLTQVTADSICKSLTVGKCECGSSSVGSSKHSDYCPLHDPKA